MFLLLGLVMAIMGNLCAFLIYVLVTILHEAGHALVAKKLGYSLNGVSLLPFGAGLSINQNFYNERDEIMVAIAGPVTNFIFIVVTISLWWIFPSLYVYTSLFVWANFITALINLLPCYPMDGGRILVGYLSINISRKKAINISNIFSYIFSFLFIIIFIITALDKINFTFGLMAIFIFLGTIEDKFRVSYEPTKFKKKKISDVKNLAVDEEISLYKVYKSLSHNKYNIIYINFKSGKTKQITENLFFTFLEKYPPETTFSQLFALNLVN